MKCVNCKNCIGYDEGFYICQIGEDLEAIEECIANDDNQGCDLFVDDMDDDY